jgi:hypothetical protein
MFERSSGKEKFLEEVERKKWLALARGYGPNYVSSFIEGHKKDLREHCRQRNIPCPFLVQWRKWGAERDEEMARYRAKKAALEEERAVMKTLNDNIASLCGSE